MSFSSLQLNAWPYSHSISFVLNFERKGELLHMWRLTNVVFLFYSLTIWQVSFNVFWYPLEGRALIFLFSHIGQKRKCPCAAFRSGERQGIQPFPHS